MLLHRTFSEIRPDQIDEMFRRWQQRGDERARERLVEQYLPLAYKLARRYRGAREPVGDLRQVASVGLLKAINNYDPSRASGFVPYAVPTILGELRRYFRDCGWAVHLPRGIQDLALKVEKARRELEVSHASVTATVIAEYLELSVEEVLEAIEANAAHHAISFDLPAGEDGDTVTLAQTFGTVESGYDRVETAAMLEQASEALTDRERHVLDRRFQADLTQAQIAVELGVSQMQVSRIIRGALDQLADRLVVAEA